MKLNAKCHPFHIGVLLLNVWIYFRYAVYIHTHICVNNIQCTNEQELQVKLPWLTWLDPRGLIADTFTDPLSSIRYLYRIGEGRTQICKISRYLKHHLDPFHPSPGDNLWSFWIYDVMTVEWLSLISLMSAQHFQDPKTTGSPCRPAGNTR